MTFNIDILMNIYWHNFAF